MKLIAIKINLQTLLYILAFVSFGIGDSVSGAHMMTVRGPYAEANPVLRDMFITFGLEYMVLAKLWVTAIMLFAIHIYQWRHKGRIYWTVNGTLLAIIAGGLIGTYFNIRVLNGAMPSEPGLVIFIYAAIVLIFIELGNLIDGPAS